MKGKKSTITTILLVVILLAGLSLLLYPTVSNYWNARHQSRAIADYAQQVADMDEAEYAVWRTQAQQWNAARLQQIGTYTLSEGQRAAYEQILNISGTGIIGYIEIPKMDCSLPIYHGTEESVLQIAVGHLEWTSLPVGGENTHCVLSAHRGLPSAKLFTDLDELVEGDVFTLHVLDETLAYQVDQILVVEPQETEALQIIEGGDYCTLMTCTPYGINSHRLLVRGHRIALATQAQTMTVSGDADQLDPLLVAPIAVIPFLLLLILLLLPERKERSSRR